MDPMPTHELVKQILDNSTNKVDAFPKIFKVIKWACMGVREKKPNASNGLWI